MRIEHIAIWVKDLERMKEFYTTFFDGEASLKYMNEKKQFSSYFISFNRGARLELMHNPNIPKNKNSVDEQNQGLIHMAISVDTKDNVDRLTDSLRNNGFRIVGEPRTTGDGYYESVILDPENNRIEITN